MNDRLQQLALFVRTVESGNFSKAAREFGLSHLGLALDCRARAPIGGQAPHPHHPAGFRPSQQCVALPPEYGVRRVVPLLPAFFAQRPLLKIDLMMSDRYENLIAEGADVALRIGDLPDSSFVARKLESTRRLFIASPSYLGGRGAPVSLADLAGHDVIGGPADVGDETWIGRRNGRIERQLVSFRVRSRSATGVVACAVAGLGVATASIWMCAEALASGEAVEILTDYALDPVQAYVVFPAGRRPSQRARAFSDYLEHALSPVHPLRNA